MNNIYDEIYNNITSKLNELDLNNITEEFRNDLSNKKNVYEALAVLCAYYNKVKNISEYKSIKEYCKYTFKLNCSDKLLEKGLEEIVSSQYLPESIKELNPDYFKLLCDKAKNQYDDVMKKLPDDKYIVFYNKLKEFCRKYNIIIGYETNLPSSEEVISKINDVGEMMSSLPPENKLTEKDVINQNKENLDSAVNDFNSNTNNPLSSEMVAESMKERGIATNKAVMNYEIDMNNDPRKLTIPSSKFKKLVGVVNKYMSWLRNENLIVEKSIMKDESGHLSTTIVVKDGNIYNLTATCKKAIKDVIIDNIDKINKCSNYLISTKNGVKEWFANKKIILLNSIGDKMQNFSEKMDDVANSAFKVSDKTTLPYGVSFEDEENIGLGKKIKADTLNKIGDVASGMSDSANEASNKLYVRADEMLNNLKEKPVIALAGNSIENNSKTM